MIQNNIHKLILQYGFILVGPVAEQQTGANSSKCDLVNNFSYLAFSLSVNLTHSALNIDHVSG